MKASLRDHDMLDSRNMVPPRDRTRLSRLSRLTRLTRSRCFVLAVIAAVSPATSRPDDAPPALRIAEEAASPQQAGTRRVEVLSGDAALLASPAEGLWSIATGWSDGWPAGWRHATPDSVERAGPWTVLRGKLDAPGGTWLLSDSYRPDGRAIRCVRRWTWRGERPAERTTLSVRFVSPGTGPRVVLPGILYHGNPSGARSGRVPVYAGKPGEEAIFEEHRYPMPFASLEWPTGDPARESTVEDPARGAPRQESPKRETPARGSPDAFRGVALHALPAPVPHGSVRDQWWSLGVAAVEGGTELTLLSGPCASNGRRSVVKAVQPGFVPYPEAVLSVPPGAVIEKTFWLEAFPVETEGSGFRRPVRTSLEIFEPYGLEGLPGFREILEAKHRFAKTRWYEEGDVAGFRKYPDRDIFVLGWCGQAAAPGYALQVLAEGLGDPDAIRRAEKTLDFLSGAAFYEGGFHTWYDCRKEAWHGHEPLSQGQAMLSFAKAIRVGRKRGAETGRWEAFLRKACEFHAAKILEEGWSPRSTDLAFLIAPLCEAHRLFGVEPWRAAAEKAGRAYAARHVSMREPYWGGTLDASCEDKEGAFAALQGFLALHEITGEAEFLRWAEHACDVVLTYVVVWDIDLPPGRLRNHGFKTRGWTAVSPQNQHIDVFGVLIATDIFRLGRILGCSDLERLAIVMFRSCGQLLDPWGSQGEQPQQTNYAQRGRVDDVLALRGGYAEDWTVFWITAHFLNAAAQLAELGVPLWD